jgi:galactonate dehydratase
MGTGALCSVKPGEAALLDPKDKIKITRIETFFVQPRSVFLKMSTDAGIVGWGEPSLGL